MITTALSLNGYNIEILNVFYLFVILFGILVIIVKNPIISILFLIGLFSIISVYLIILDISFIGLSYLIVYIGAVSILFLFILMLIDIRVSELQSNFISILPLSIFIILCFNFFISGLLPYNIVLNNYGNFYTNLNLFYGFYNNNYYINTNDNILLVTSQIWDSNITNVSHIVNIGSIIYTNYSIWLIISSYILLLAMTGVIVITIKQK